MSKALWSAFFICLTAAGCAQKQKQTGAISTIAQFSKMTLNRLQITAQPPFMDSSSLYNYSISIDLSQTPAAISAQFQSGNSSSSNYASCNLAFSVSASDDAQLRSDIQNLSICFYTPSTNGLGVTAPVGTSILDPTDPQNYLGVYDNSNTEIFDALTYLPTSFNWATETFVCGNENAFDQILANEIKGQNVSTCPSGYLAVFSPILN